MTLCLVTDTCIRVCVYTCIVFYMYIHVYTWCLFFFISHRKWKMETLTGLCQVGVVMQIVYLDLHNYISHSQLLVCSPLVLFLPYFCIGHFMQYNLSLCGGRERWEREVGERDGREVWEKGMGERGGRWEREGWEREVGEGGGRERWEREVGEGGGREGWEREVGERGGRGRWERGMGERDGRERWEVGEGGGRGRWEREVG